MGVLGHYIKDEALVYSGFDVGFFSLKRKNILLRSFTFMLNMLKAVVTCHQNKEAIHNKTTYKLSTATSVTSFIDTFFCSIIWTISPVGKHMTFYFQHKAKRTWLRLCLRDQHPNIYMCLQSHSPILTRVSCLQATEKPDTSSSEEKGLQLVPNFA